ncbi:MAG TPA: hypothetical protein VJZ71_05585 [Phycisphaerae bacterium]|nr:hypothetical protein [Phycisphaerae bacterium]
MARSTTLLNIISCVIATSFFCSCGVEPVPSPSVPQILDESIPQNRTVEMRIDTTAQPQPSDQAVPQPEPSYITRCKVIAKSGDQGITSIHRFPSVNDHGVVAFAAAYQNPGLNVVSDNLFSYDPSSPSSPPLRQLCKDGFALQNSQSSTPWQTFTPRIQINNSGEVVTRRYLTARVQIGFPFGQILDMPLTYIEGWDANLALPHQDQNGVLHIPDQFAGGDAGIGPAWVFLFFLNPISAGSLPTPFVPLSPYAGLQPHFSINNLGQCVFVGLTQSFQNVLATPLAAPYFYFEHIPTGDTTLENLNPVLADNETLVLFEREGGTGHVRLYTYDLTSLTPIAEAPYYSTVGTRPGLSDDGQLIVFCGDLTQVGADALQPGYAGPDQPMHRPGRGVFARFVDSQGNVRVVRAAGLRENAVVDPGEWYQDTNFNGIFDPPPGGSETDDGPISAFHVDARVCANNNGYVLFLADDAAGNKSAFLCRVNRENMQYPVSTPLRVLGIGDAVAGLDGAITDIDIYDSLSNRGDSGDIVLWCRTALDQQAVIAAELIRQPVIFVPGSGASYLESVPCGLTADASILWFGGRTLIGPPLPCCGICGLSISEPFVIATDVGRTFLGQPVYNVLIDTVLHQQGYREYMVDKIPGRRTRAGWDISQDMQHPNFFPFAYDWRKSNYATANDLHEYVLAIQDAYRRIYDDPDLDVNVQIIAHSMGGLVARRYLLDHPGENVVSRLVTIGSPFLGAPKVPLILEHGEWFNVEKFGYGWLPRAPIRDVVGGFAGAHELITSPAYYLLGRDSELPPFIEDGWDFNNNGNPFDTYDYETLRATLDSKYIPNHPGTTNELFHLVGQDDWRSDSSGVELLHVIGDGACNDTVVQVRAALRRNNLGFEPHLEESRGRGDQTVPLLSATRINIFGDDLNAPGATLCVQRAGIQGNTESDVEHTALTGNRNVLRNATHFLSTGEILECQPAAPAIRPSLYIRLTGVPDPVISDSAGHTGTIVGQAALAVPHVSHSFIGPNSHDFVMPANQTYTVQFSAPSTSVGIQVLLGQDERSPVIATRWLDLALPPSTITRLVVSADGASTLLNDADADGTPEALIAPFAAVSGAAAADSQSPTVRFCRSVAGTSQLVTIYASDVDSGVHDINYSVDGVHIAPYTGPFSIDPIVTTVVYADATDNVGNRSSFIANRGEAQFASNVTTMIAVERGPIRFRRHTQRYEQVIVMKNVSSMDIPCAAPVSLVLDRLSAGVVLFNATGVTTVRQPPTGSPYVNTDAGTDGIWKSSEKFRITLEFTNSTQQQISYTPRVLVGVGDR